MVLPQKQIFVESFDGVMLHFSRGFSGMLLTGTLRTSGSFDDVLGTAAVIERADN